MGDDGGGGGLYIGFGMIAGVWRYHGLELFWIAFDVEWMDFGGVSSSFSVELREHKLGTFAGGWTCRGATLPGVI